MAASKDRASARDAGTEAGRWAALVIGVGGLAGAVVLAAIGAEMVVVTIVALIGGSALLGWARPRRAR